MSDDKPELTRVGSLCNPDPQIQLLDAWMSRDFPKFRDLLKQPGVSADHWYGDPLLATCLYLASKEEDGAQYASALLEAGAQPNNLNRIRNKAPIHIAAESARVEVLKVLLSNPSTDVNIMDSFGNTPLHIIAKQKLTDASEETVNKYKHCIQLLMDQSGFDVNIVNRKGYTAIHFGAQNDAKVVVQTILKHAGNDLDVDRVIIRTGKSARDIILEKYPKFSSLLPEHGRAGDTKQTINSSTLFEDLYYRKFDSFITGIAKVPNEQLEKSDGSYTLLQYCAEYGLESPAIALLDKGVNPNATCLAEPRPPALLACYGGHAAILELLFLRRGPEFVDLKSADGGEETAFHAVLASPREDTSTVHRDYKRCFNLLLENLPKLKIDINAVDLKGNTALHYAAKNKDDDDVFALLNHGAYIGIKNVFGEPPLANMTPKVLEAFLNDCLGTNDKFPREDTYEVTFSYKFLVPPPGECRMPEKQNSHIVETLPLHICQSPSEPPDQNIPTETTNTETEPLLYISQSRDLRHLLKHPVFTSFLDLKWHSIRIFFYINLIFYILFVTSLTLYILTSYGKSQIINSNNTSVISGSVTEKSGGESSTVVKGNISDLWWFLSVLFLILLILREIFQLVVSPSKYLRSPENCLELLLLITSVSILFSEWVYNNAMPHFSAIVILLSWAELVLLIGRHPRLSTNIEMFKTVSWNFLKFLAWYAILIIAFALSFYTLFRGDGGSEFFLNPGMSVFKTIVMLTGEFDTASIPFVSFPGTSHIVFILFIFLIAIVLFNLLNGLAVSDTQAIRDDAEVVTYVSRVKLLSHIETLFQNSSPPFLDTLKRICCCCPMGTDISLKAFTSRVRLFPHKVPDNKIRVLPNQGSKIIFTKDQNKHQEEEERSRCCPDGCKACTLDSGILKRAIEIINNRGQISEIEELRTLLTISQKKLEKVEKSCEKTEAMLGKILNTLLQPSSSSSSSNK